MTYHVTCNTDNNYAQHCCAMLCSLFENNKECEFHVHVLTHSLSEKNTDEIGKLCNSYGNKYTIYDVDETKLEGVKFRKNRPLTKAAYYRILLPEILSNGIDKVLYIDCDMIIVGTVKELYDLEIEKYALAATLDCMPWNSIHRNQLQMEADERSFCSGIMMINLKYWRNTHATERLLDFSQKERSPVYLHDQDAFNYVFVKQWFLLPPKWNKASFSYLPAISGLAYFDIYEYVYQPKIIHFSSQAKPWLKIKTPYSHLYRKYLFDSGFEQPVFHNVSANDRLLFTIWNCKYIIRKYIIPLMPTLVMTIVADVLKFCKLLIFMTNSKRMKNFILKESIKAINQ